MYICIYILYISNDLHYHFIFLMSPISDVALLVQVWDTYSGKLCRTNGDLYTCRDLFQLSSCGSVNVLIQMPFAHVVTVLGSGRIGPQT